VKYSTVLLAPVKESRKKLYSDAALSSLENAHSLLEDAYLLQKNERLPRAFALAILAAEEVGKAFMYRCISAEMLDEEKTRKMIIDHKEKILQTGHLLLVTTLYIKNWDKISAAIEHDKGKLEHKDHIYLDTLTKYGLESAELMIDTFKNAHDIKMDCIYVDVKGNKIGFPANAVDASKCKELIELVRDSLGPVKGFLVRDDESFAKLVKTFMENPMLQLKQETERER
jgi:AbiV family abortive infection protein